MKLRPWQLDLVGSVLDATPPAEPKRLEGLDCTTAILDEIGVVSRDTYEVLTFAQGKRETSTLIGIGTPGPDPHYNVLGPPPPSTSLPVRHRHRRSLPPGRCLGVPQHRGADP